MPKILPDSDDNVDDGNGDSAKKNDTIPISNFYLVFILIAVILSVIFIKTKVKFTTK